MKERCIISDIYKLKENKIMSCKYKFQDCYPCYLYMYQLLIKCGN